MTGQLSFWDCRHIEEILSDQILINALIMDGEKACNIFVNQVDGTITIGRTQYIWLNWIFKDTRVISFTDFAFKVANALAGQMKNRNEVIFEGISRVVLDNAIKENNYHYVVDALFDTMRLGWNGNNKSSFTNIAASTPKTERLYKSHNSYPSYMGNIRLNSGECLGKVIVETR